ncbi:TetR/AcrR family transcriptional regulator [Haloferax sp. AS1]|uniref:TetR/AcrR family transcriptional regulator n=1 Tax=Haloferax sp. AS1 TaxID=2562277 RepID=UPI00165FA8EB|nr:TetR/AcrR family transcriptional regulator [Haloferax sp. AS1]
MKEKHSFLENPKGTEEEIIQATFNALCEYGYANLTIERIGEHFDKSNSLIYKHFDDKDDLLLEFLSLMIQEMKQSIPPGGDVDPAPRLKAVLNGAFSAEQPGDEGEFKKAIVELRAQAAHDQRYRDKLSSYDEFMQQRLKEVIQAGVEKGQFRDVDPDAVSSYIYTVLHGFQTLRSTSDTDIPKMAEPEIDAYLNNTLYAE